MSRPTIADESLARIADHHGSPSEHTIRALDDDETVVFRGWRLGLGEGPVSVHGRFQVCFWITTGGGLVVGLRRHPPESRDTRDEWLFADEIEPSNEAVETWLDHHCGAEAHGQERYVGLTLWQALREELEME